jgi:hypothetical protein
MPDFSQFHYITEKKNNVTTLEVLCGWFLHECYVHPESKILKTNTWNLEIAIAWDGNLTGHVLTRLWSGPLYIVIYTLHICIALQCSESS